jgi:hypothetical protein
MRNTLIGKLKIEPIGSISDQTSTEESFQNRTLRPILKFQNDLLIASFKNYISTHKNIFYSYSVEKKFAFIENVFQRDSQYRNIAKGMVIGLFTIEEFQEYNRNVSNYNKRMVSMIAERLKSQLQVFE